MRIHKLVQKVKAPFLSHVLSTITIRITEVAPANPYTFDDAMSALRTSVRAHHPGMDINAPTNTRRYIRELRTPHGGRGRGGRGDRGYNGCLLYTSPSPRD